MGIRRGPNIVTDGLVFAVDAANPSSYVSGSGVWKDQTINQNNGTLTNGPTFDSGNGGSIAFDGTNDEIIGTNSTLLTFGDGSTDRPFSAFAWINIDSTSSSNPIVGKYRSYAPFRGEYFLTITTGGAVVIQLLDGAANTRCRQNSDNALSTGQWYNVGFTYNANGTDEGLVQYVNGNIFPSTSYGQDNAYVAMNRAGDPSELSIGVALDEGNTFYQSNFDGKISNVQIYAKELSASEIAQNYNALKGRFGL